jgi:hypothetical protein
MSGPFARHALARVGGDDPQIAYSLLLASLLLKEKRGEAVDRHDRRLEFAGELIDEILPERLYAPRLLAHLVEIQEHVLEGPCPLRVEPGVEVPFGYARDSISALRRRACILQRSSSWLTGFVM